MIDTIVNTSIELWNWFPPGWQVFLEIIGKIILIVLPLMIVVVFDRSGHYPFIEEPDTFWATVATFLAPPADTDTRRSAPSG